MAVTSGTTSGTSMGGGKTSSNPSGGGPGGGSLSAPARTAPSSAPGGQGSGSTSKTSSSTPSSTPSKSSTPSSSPAKTSTTPSNPTGGSLQSPARTATSSAKTSTQQNAIDKAKQAATQYGGAQQSMRSASAAPSQSVKVTDPSRGIVSASGAVDDGIYSRNFSTGQNTLPGQKSPNQFDKTISPTNFSNVNHVPMDTFSNGYNPNKLDAGAQKLHQAITDNAFRTNTPVDFFSGMAPRSTGTKQHALGQAIDVRLKDPVTGAFVGSSLVGPGAAANPIGNTRAKRDALSGPYRSFAEGVLNSLMSNPDVYGSFNNQRWGGAFQSGVNPRDYMHYDEGKVTKGVSADQSNLRKEAMNYNGPSPVTTNTLMANIGGVPGLSTGAAQPTRVASANPVSNIRGDLYNAPAGPQRPTNVASIATDPRVSQTPVGSYPGATHVVQASAAPPAMPGQFGPAHIAQSYVENLLSGVMSHLNPSQQMASAAPAAPAAPAPTTPTRQPATTSVFSKNPVQQAMELRSEIQRQLGNRAVASAGNPVNPTSSTEINIPSGSAGTPPSQQGTWAHDQIAPSQQGTWAPDENFTQAAGQPQSLGELNNRYHYEKDRAKEGLHELPSKIADAILHGDFRHYSGNQNDGRSYADPSFRSSQNHNVGGQQQAGAAQHQAALVTLLMKLIQQQSAGNPQASLVNSTFV